MTLSFDFGFEGQGVPFEKAAIVLLFQSDAAPTRLFESSGPAAIADTSRFIELFEMQIGVIPYAAGIYAEIIPSNQVDILIKRAQQVTAAGKTPIIISNNRKVTGLMAPMGLSALWGKLGRDECNEAKLFSRSRTFLAGVRAASNQAFKSVNKSVVLLTASALMREPSHLTEALSKLESPMHLSIDLDVLAPKEVLNKRCLEPGGLDWYTLVDTTSALFNSVKIASVDVTGCTEIAPRSPASHLGAQLVLKLAGLLAAQKSAEHGALK